MQHQLHQSIARQQFLAYEQNRRDPRRQLFWNEGEWQDRLLDVIAEDAMRDAQLRNRINSLELNHPQHSQLAQALYTAIDNDAAWYRWFLDDLRSWRANTSRTQALSQQQSEELLQHEDCVEYQLHERYVERDQVITRFLEHRRALDGRIANGDWALQWQRLQHTWYQQQRFCMRAYAPGAMERLLHERLQWCVKLYELQQTVGRQWGKDRAFDRAGFRADTQQVLAEIERLRPARKAVPYRKVMFALALGAAAVMLLWYTSESQNRGGPSLLPTPAVAVASHVPDASTMSASFAAHVGQGPGGIENTATPRQTAVAGVTADDEMAEHHNNQALQHMIQGNCSAAIPLYKAAAEADPFFYEPPNNLAFCLYEQGNVSGAITQWNVSIGLKPDNADAYAGLGMAFDTGGNHEVGEQHYRQALSLNPNYANEQWLRTTALWSERAIVDSRAVRLRSTR